MKRIVEPPKLKTHKTSVYFILVLKKISALPFENPVHAAVIHTCIDVLSSDYYINESLPKIEGKFCFSSAVTSFPKT